MRRANRNRREIAAGVSPGITGPGAGSTGCPPLFPGRGDPMALTALTFLLPALAAILAVVGGAPAARGRFGPNFAQAWRDALGYGALLPGIVAALVSLGGRLEPAGALALTALSGAFGVFCLGVSLGAGRALPASLPAAGPVVAFLVAAALHASAFVSEPLVEYATLRLGGPAPAVDFITATNPVALAAWHGAGRDLFGEGRMYLTLSPIGKLYHSYPTLSAAAGWYAVAGLGLLAAGAVPRRGETARGPSRGGFTVYDAAYLLFVVGGCFYFAWRLSTSGKWRRGLFRRLGLEKLPVRAGSAPCLWFHGVSVGEVLSARTLIRRARERFPDCVVAVSATTPAGMRVAKDAYRDSMVFYYPLDLSWVVARFLDNVRPAVIVLMELELWPNLLAAAHARGVPVIVANGRISERSFPKYRLFRPLLAPMFSRVAAYSVQTTLYRDRLVDMGVPPDRVRVTGSLKYDNVETDPRGEIGPEMRRALGISPAETVLLAGSTHAPEEEIVARVHRRLQQATGRAIRLIVCPRHAERAADVARLLAVAGSAGAAGGGVAGAGAFPVMYSALRAGATPAGDPAPAPIVVDAVGVLGKLYAAADLVFVGGSLLPRGGQNMLEPAGLGKPVLFGPHVFNFQETVDKMRAGNGAIQVEGEADLFERLLSLLSRPAEAAALGARGRNVILAEKGATLRTLDMLADALAAPR
ncbi:MAG: 3-deoxy-D-manno-octulosonic acid transferase [Planctomycetes bacterium]|nr:3-deoxy-D-manno-octulosonic acid transferase [Planctomycetota bacterium]